MIPRNAFKARLTALESLRTIWTINVSSEIATRSEGVLERFYAMVVFRLLSGRQIDLTVPDRVPDPKIIPKKH